MRGPATRAEPEGPVRTCVGCRRRAVQVELVRIVRTTQGSLLLSRTAAGRGAWLCAGSLVCLDRAAARGALGRALRGPLATGALELVRDQLSRQQERT